MHLCRIVNLQQYHLLSCLLLQRYH